jgi:L-seryl-tRNA(Ser) seleniumtransferase
MPDSNPYSELPSTAVLLDRLSSRGLVLAHPIAVTLINDVLSEVRAQIAAGQRPTRNEIEQHVVSAGERLMSVRLTPVINATGVILHTNLGRAPVSEATAEAMRSVAAGYVSLEIDPETGQRGGRMDEISQLMHLLTGGEATLVVNNNAAAVLLTLSALAASRSVIISRGEAVEIGGGFRIPDVLRQSGAHLVEVGTTNRTYARDYANAIDETTAVLLKVHPSNFSISGFTATTSVEELVEIAQPRGIPVVEDLGSGALLDTRQFGLEVEPTIGSSLAAGASLVTASGDKLLGGPQAGIISGSREWVARVERHPLARAVRADKTCLAGLARTLRHYLMGDEVTEIPLWRMISATPESLRERARSIIGKLPGTRWNVEIAQSEATIGGGSLPGQTMASVAIAVSGNGLELDAFARNLRLGDPSVFARIAEDRVLLDMRTVLPEDDNVLADALNVAFSPPA